MCSNSQALELAADESVILAFWQLKDKVADSGFWRGTAARFLCLLFRGSYSRARARQPDFDAAVRNQLCRLHRLEEDRCASIDRPADTFARLLCAAVPSFDDVSTDRTMEQLLYHLGRWIYLIDARDDLQEDQKSGNYNPVALRFPSNERDKQLAVTLEHSVNLMRSAAALLELKEYEPLVQNVLQYGIPMVQRAVLSGEWTRIKKQKIWRIKHDRSLQRVGS